MSGVESMPVEGRDASFLPRDKKRSVKTLLLLPGAFGRLAALKELHCLRKMWQVLGLGKTGTVEKSGSNFTW